MQCQIEKQKAEKGRGIQTDAAMAEMVYYRFENY
jgi:hypothetical protein